MVAATWRNSRIPLKNAEYLFYLATKTALLGSWFALFWVWWYLPQANASPLRPILSFSSVESVFPDISSLRCHIFLSSYQFLSVFITFLILLNFLFSFLSVPFEQADGLCTMTVLELSTYSFSGNWLDWDLSASHAAMCLFNNNFFLITWPLFSPECLRFPA